MKHKTLSLNMSRSKAAEYMSNNNYRLPTKAEVVLYGEKSLWYWYDNKNTFKDNLNDLFIGNYIVNNKGSVSGVSKNVKCPVLCIWDFDNTLLENSLIDFKNEKISMKELVNIITNLL